MPVPDHHCYCDGPAASPLLDTDDELDGLFEFEKGDDVSAFATDIRPRPALAEASIRARELITHQVESNNTYSSKFVPQHLQLGPSASHAKLHFRISDLIFSAACSHVAQPIFHALQAD